MEVTLKTGTKSQTSISEVSDFGKLRAGEIISGTIRRIESYGLFITIDQTNMVIFFVICFLYVLPIILILLIPDSF